MWIMFTAPACHNSTLAKHLKCSGTMAWTGNAPFAGPIYGPVGLRIADNFSQLLGASASTPLPHWPVVSLGSDVVRLATPCQAINVEKYGYYPITDCGMDIPAICYCRGRPITANPYVYAINPYQNNENGCAGRAIVDSALCEGVYLINSTHCGCNRTIVPTKPTRLVLYTAASTDRNDDVACAAAKPVACSFFATLLDRITWPLANIDIGYGIDVGLPIYSITGSYVAKNYSQLISGVNLSNVTSFPFVHLGTPGDNCQGYARYDGSMGLVMLQNGTRIPGQPCADAPFLCLCVM